MITCFRSPIPAQPMLKGFAKIQDYRIIGHAYEE
jgi:hypothetical protein